MSASAAVWLYGAGAATIGFWLAARLPQLGPQGVLGATAAVVATSLVLAPTPMLTGRAALAFGPAAALACVVLPSLTLLSWSVGCLVRALQSAAARDGFR